MRSRRLAFYLFLFLIVTLWTSPLLGALPPLETFNFPVGTIVVPMDQRQAERVVVFGFIHAVLRKGAEILRIIQPPDVTLKTTLDPGGGVYAGGVVMLETKYSSIVDNVKSQPEFSKVTTTTLTESFSSNNVFRVRKPTEILVITGIGGARWGRTDITLSNMKIPFDIVNKSEIEANPSKLFDYSLIVIDCPGWFGKVPSAIANNLRTHVERGNEVIFTDIALMDLDSVWPGYVQLGTAFEGTTEAVVHNPPEGFSPEFPSQYWNPGPMPNIIKVYSHSGGKYVANVLRKSDVRILVDTKFYGGDRYAAFAFYFEYGRGIVEGLGNHPQEQTIDRVGLAGHFAVHALYGNKFVHGPPTPDFEITAQPASRNVEQGQATTYTVSIRSINAFSSSVTLSASGLPAGSSASFNPLVPSPPPGSYAQSTLTVTTAISTPAGSYQITIKGTSGSLEHETQVTLIVVERPADFSLDVEPDTLTINLTKSETATVTVTSQGSFSADVNLEIMGLPSDVEASFSINPVHPAAGETANSVLTVAVGATANPGTYSLEVKGTSGSLSHAKGITLIVLKPPVPQIPVWLIVVLVTGSTALALVAAYLAVRRRGLTRGPILPAGVRARGLPPAKRVPFTQQGVICLFCRRMIPAQAVYCPYCGRSRAFPPRPIRAIFPARVRYRPPLPRQKAVWGFVFSLSAGILVLTNAAAILSANFWGAPVNWSSIFWWLPGIGQSLAFIIGLIIGLVIVVDSIFMLLGYWTIASLIVLPLAAVSLIIGGGFIAAIGLGFIGTVLGLIGR